MAVNSIVLLLYYCDVVKTDDASRMPILDSPILYGKHALPLRIGLPLVPRKGALVDAE
ncbi:hypothetical protein J2Z22_001175 [Paenibacillus forsythiae]|uniref:Uncharacterized protein n=1 Tax=Paenibacillus forsythiae TaxID=365616 RepID=A0ABU3H5A5_9BACL|nr:hypothetical protein [Paenibacillus forsythiae]MDT3425656.1 hypothetical protein [Paenibacillus forsythiae]